VNYARQIALQLMQDGGMGDAERAAGRIDGPPALAMLSGTEKFLLPPGGVLLDDPAFCALDPTVPLRLPFPKVFLEWAMPPPPEGDDPGEADDPGFVRSAPTKRALLAAELPEASGSVRVPEGSPQGGVIFCRPFFWFPCHGRWSTMEPFLIPQLDYLEEVRPGGPKSFVTISATPGRNEYSSGGPLLSLLNALACNDVGTETTTSGRPKGGRSPKTPLGFDSYHTLVLGGGRGGSGASTGTGRSPREHVRRGHIRRLPTGSYTWVNAAVIAAGSGGRVQKTYRVR
jgi:hypothetical protein